MSAGESRSGMKIIVEALGWTEGNWEQCRMIKEKVQQVPSKMDRATVATCSSGEAKRVNSDVLLTICKYCLWI